jgi:CRISPR-associated exonuclease Cas4
MPVPAMFTEDELLPLSALQHLVFCERQCALIYVEHVWVDNALTLEGTHLHAGVHADAPAREWKGDRLTTRRVHLRSLRLGVSGIADVVEYESAPLSIAVGGRSSIELDGLDGLWRPFPVEYKRGRPKSDQCDEVQLCAQAICLEEMLDVTVADGAIYYGQPQRRVRVTFSEKLRNQTMTAAARLQELVRLNLTPRGPRAPKCKRCSLLDICRPSTTGAGHLAGAYLAREVGASLRGA